MAQAPRLKISDTESLPVELEELQAAVSALPEAYQATLTSPLKRVVESTQRRRRILNLVQDALSQLRMDLKYLIFDLDATRRERDEFKQQLEDSGSSE
ncbi:MAG: transcriptional regulator [Pirellulales bacterium]|nr:transcriptional regulator [Pirellulales bacterium]